ncbi:MAG: aminotransferase class III-fold pyridoxal phosphate-dependent enzyme, partial [archaeon]
MQVYWGQSGSMVTDFAIKLVGRATQRPYILSFTGSYHGSSMGALSLPGEWLGMDHWKVKPDVTLLGKSIASGVPLSACLLSSSLLESTDTEPIPIHAQSFSANPFGIAAAHATLDVITNENLCDNSRKIGSYMKKGLIDLMDRHLLNGDVRGPGLLIGVE